MGSGPKPGPPTLQNPKDDVTVGPRYVDTAGHFTFTSGVDPL